MSSAFIVALVVVGIFALIILGYLNNQYEKKKLEQARRRSALVDRQMRLATLSEGLPPQYLTATIKQGLHELELGFINELLKLDDSQIKLQARGEELRERISLGTAYRLPGEKLSLHSEEQVKEIRFQLESLHAQLKRAIQDGAVPVNTGRQWLAHLQEQLINLYLDFFHASGQNHLQRGQARQARLVFERAVGLIKRQKNLQPFTERLQVFDTLLQKTNAIVMAHDQSAASQASELSASMAEAEDDDLWKKKQMYD